jgi:RNA polymerase sigma-70 factor (ECF subfamily)
VATLAFFVYLQNVFSMNPTFVDTESLDMRSLLDQARSGDAEAFGEVCRIHESRLLRQAMTLCNNPATAEDLAQDTLVEAWKSLRRYNGGCQFFTWLCAILLNLYRNSIRRKRPLPLAAFSREDRDAIQVIMASVPDRQPLPDETSQLHEQAVLVQQCIQALPAKHQQVVYLRFYVEDSLDGIACALGCSAGTVKSRLFHALNRLRAMKAISAQFSNLKTKGEMP